MKRVCALFFAFICCMNIPYGQVVIATVSGQVSDSFSAVVAGAKATWTGTSNGPGVYLLKGLRPRRYQIRVGKNGFKGIDQTDLILKVQNAPPEFRLQTTTYAPEFRRTPSGQISGLTRPGANQLHGSAFDYFRSDLYGATTWFADGSGQPKPREQQNGFRGTFTGPLLRGWTSFFFFYEGLSLQPRDTELAGVSRFPTCDNG